MLQLADRLHLGELALYAKAMTIIDGSNDDEEEGMDRDASGRSTRLASLEENSHLVLASLPRPRLVIIAFPTSLLLHDFYFCIVLSSE